MRAIQKYLPHPMHSETIRIFVNANPGVAWEAARNYNMSSIPWVNMLFKLRTIGDIFHHSKPEFGDTKKGVIDEIAEHDQGFIILEERPGKDVTIGAIGKFWHFNIPFKKTTSSQFRHFNEPGWGKVAWSISVEPFMEGSTICFDLRTSATDHESWIKLNRYYFVIGMFSKLIRHSLMDRLEQSLGKMTVYAEENTSVQGDEIISQAKHIDTDKIIIEAPVSIVWAYLMQLGCDRAGWYSIDLIDNDNRRSVDHLVSEWTDRQVGDKLSATPAGDSFFEVYKLEHEKYFVIGGEIERSIDYFKSTWAFELHPIGEDASYLIVRARMMMSPSWKEWLMGTFFYPVVHGIMEGVQLKTIKKYSERDANQRTPIADMIYLEND
jgi:hypothetical protein